MTPHPEHEDELTTGTSVPRPLLAVIGVAALVGVVAFAAIHLGGGSSPTAGSAPSSASPTSSSPTWIISTLGPSPAPRPGLPDDKVLRRVIRQGQQLAEGSYDRGETLTVFRDCSKDFPGCRVAWQLHSDRENNTISSLLDTGVTGSVPQVYPAGSGYVIKSWNWGGLLVRSDGSTRQLRLTDTMRLQPDLVPVMTRNGFGLVDPRWARLWLMPELNAKRGGHLGAQSVAVDSHGTVWYLRQVRRQGRVWLTRVDAGGSHTWRIQDPTSQREIPGNLVVWDRPDGATQVGVLTTYDGATSTPVGVITVTSDGGDTWTTTTGRDVPMPTIESWAVAPRGTLYAADVTGQLWRSTDDTWTSFEKVLAGTLIWTVERAGDHVMVFRQERGGDSDIVWLDDEGLQSPRRR